MFFGTCPSRCNDEGEFTIGRFTIYDWDGAGAKEHFRDVFLQGKADAALAASVFHFGEIKIPELKSYLCAQGIAMRR